MGQALMTVTIRVSANYSAIIRVTVVSFDGFIRVTVVSRESIRVSTRKLP